MTKISFEHKYSIGQTVWLIMLGANYLWRVRKKRGFKIIACDFYIFGDTRRNYYFFEKYRSSYPVFEEDVFSSFEEAEAECDRLNAERLKPHNGVL